MDIDLKEAAEIANENGEALIVDVDGYEGPLDVLLALARVQKVDLRKISILALAGEPQVVFLDEPTAGVDTESQEKFYALLRKLNEELNLTLVLISHDIGIIASEATEMAHVNRKLTYHGSSEEFADLKIIATHRH